MKLSLLSVCAFPMILALTGCSVLDRIVSGEDTPSVLTVTSPDLTLQLAIVAHQLPPTRLALSAFDRSKIGGLVNQPALTVVERPAGVELSTAPGAHVTLDVAHGGFLLTTVATGAPAFEASEGPLGATTISTIDYPNPEWHPSGLAADPPLTTLSVAGSGSVPSLNVDIGLLGRWGIPTDEILRSFSAQTMAVNFESGVAQTPTPHRFKSFAIRGFDNIAIRGHRAVISHAPDGRITRILTNWPALASTGHVLSTRLAASDILARATSAMSAERITMGNAKVSLEYVPTVLPTGECTLKLTGVVKVQGSEPTGDHGDETRAFDFDIAAY